MKLLVATDLSATGDAAVARALQWAQHLGAEVTLLHVVADPVLAPAFTDDVGGDVARARRTLEAVAATAGVPCRVDVHTAENVADSIAAASRGVDYLFLGAQGKSAFERLRLGSVAIQVLRHSVVPVVCCPAHGAPGAGHRA